MIKEYYTVKNEDESIMIEDSKIKSYKNSNITEKSVRVFDEKKKLLALAAAKGNVPDCELEKKAIDLFSLNMPYDYELEKDLKANFTMDKLNIADLNKFTTNVLKDLKHLSKHYVFSGQSKIKTTELSLRNNLGLDLLWTRKFLNFDLSMKLKGSGNIFDTGTGIHRFDVSEQNYKDFIKDTEFLAMASRSNEVKLESKPYILLLNEGLILQKLYEDINGISYEEKTSLLAGKQGKKVFHEDICIIEPHINEGFLTFVPFDHEGIVNVYDTEIITNGVLKTILYDKKRAKKYGKVTTGNGYRNYNSNPGISTCGLLFTGKKDSVQPDCSELLADDIVIIPHISSGGDFLPNGNYSLPVQMAFVYQNGKFIGKAPQFTLTGNYIKSLNKDFIALCNNDMWTNIFEKTLLMCIAKVNVN